MKNRPLLRAILTGGAIAGAFDITYATVFSAFYGVTPLRVLKSVAGGLLGKAAFDGGLPVAALGLALHFTVALTWAALFCLASLAMPVFRRHAIVSGVLFGALIYGTMYLVVLPNSAYPSKVVFTTASVCRNLAVHMFLIGLPIALAARMISPAPKTRSLPE
ncbi:MAG TPA: hypothetical protein VHD32_17230 [Candidatus Didemnitutus sp.]|nr:hypothetical protein [Candidatus Didemnitutus sp.]